MDVLYLVLDLWVRLNINAILPDAEMRWHVKSGEIVQMMNIRNNVRKKENTVAVGIFCGIGLTFIFTSIICISVDCSRFACIQFIYKNTDSLAIVIFIIYKRFGTQFTRNVYTLSNRQIISNHTKNFRIFNDCIMNFAVDTKQNRKYICLCDNSINSLKNTH